GHRRCLGGTGWLGACLFERVHLADEQKPAPRYCAHEDLRRAAVADRLAYRIDSGVQRHVRDDSAVPDGLDELVLADHPVAVGDQIGQQIEHLRLDMNRPVAATKLAPARIQDAVTESDNHRTMTLRISDAGEEFR